MEYLCAAIMVLCFYLINVVFNKIANIDEFDKDWKT